MIKINRGLESVGERLFTGNIHVFGTVRFCCCFGEVLPVLKLRAASAVLLFMKQCRLSDPIHAYAWHEIQCGTRRYELMTRWAGRGNENEPAEVVGQFVAPGLRL